MRILLVLSSFVIISAVSCKAAEPPAQTPSDTSAPSSKPIGVDAIVADPKAHAGAVTVTGVVAKVFPKTGSFVLIDTAEFASCGDTNCAEVTLPVQTPDSGYTGELPEVKQTVIVTGELTPLEKGFKLTVKEVSRDGKVIRQPKTATSGQ